MLSLEGLASVVSVSVWGKGCHSNGDVVSGGVWGREIGGMDFNGEAVGGKEVVNDARFLFWLLAIPWEPGDVRGRDCQAYVCKEVGYESPPSLGHWAFIRPCSWTDMGWDRKELGIAISGAQDKRSGGLFLQFFQGSLKFSKDLLKRSIPMGSEGWEVERESNKRGGGAEGGNDEMAV